ncbi:unnamed protein product [Hermetia illucens]|uniref:Peptidase S1 domain-containing protein n=2 Tax=Hermetia illucens TaxID=343691 RepID=A0A7R8Z0H9_HERIL|nr:unnamed protein product [Hermetia illucens]
MKNYNDSRNSYSVTMDESSVVPYPTGFDNIALVKLPVVLRFSEEVAPISYGSGSTAAKEDTPSYKRNNGFVVMPGFSPAHDQGLTYGMFRLISPTECKARYGKSYDEYLQICTLSWDSYNHVPCEGNEGGGLVIGWPRQPRLVGIFTSPLNCVSDMPSIYVNLARYENWINEVTRNGYKSSYYYWRFQ